MPPENWCGYDLLEALEADQRDVLGDPVALLGRGQRRVAQADGDVLLHRQPWKQPVVLEHDAALAAGRRDRLPARAGSGPS